MKPLRTHAPIAAGRGDASLGDRAAGDRWIGHAVGLNERESAIVALIVQGHSNAGIAASMYLSANTIKSYIRSAYRKMGVVSRTRAVLWGIDNGFPTLAPEILASSTVGADLAIRGAARPQGPDVSDLSGGSGRLR